MAPFGAVRLLYKYEVPLLGGRVTCVNILLARRFYLVLIVFFVIVVGGFKVDTSNWSPFSPGGFKPILTGATVVSFACVRFVAVANSAEESKRTQRDLPLGIIGSLIICIVLYIGVCLVITGMVPHQHLGEEASLAEAFTFKGLKYVFVLISFGAVAGLTTDTFCWAL